MKRAVVGIRARAGDGVLVKHYLYVHTYLHLTRIPRFARENYVAAQIIPKTPKDERHQGQSTSARNSRGKTSRAPIYVDLDVLKERLFHRPPTAQKAVRLDLQGGAGIKLPLVSNTTVVPPPFSQSRAPFPLASPHLCAACIITLTSGKIWAANFWLIGPGGGGFAKVSERGRRRQTLGAGVSSPAPVPRMSSYSTNGGVLETGSLLPSPSDPDPTADSGSGPEHADPSPASPRSP